MPEETAVALTYDGSTQAVMMATPADLEDFAVGFSLTESIVGAPSEIGSLEIVPESGGIELRMWLTKPRADALGARRRHFAGPTGCGLCGIDSLAEAVRPPAKVKGDLRLGAQEIAIAMKSLAAAQPMNRETRAVHAAGLWRPGEGLLLAREDVGRHNALDKLVGAVSRAGLGAGDCALLLTSRVSVEMVQKASVLGAPMPGCRLRSDGARRAHGGGRRNNARRRRSRRRFRSVHPRGSDRDRRRGRRRRTRLGSLVAPPASYRPGPIRGAPGPEARY